MAETKHTPGPWFYGVQKTRIVVTTDRVAVAAIPYPDAEGIADARLIAAAPELLEALQLLLNSDSEGAIASASDEELRAATTEAGDPVIRAQAAAVLKARVAIAKAEGR